MLTGMESDPVAVVLTVLLWTTTGLFLGATLFWAIEVVAFGRRASPPVPVYGAEDVQVRIFTVDAAAVVQHTVDELPPSFTDVHVAAEVPMEIAGAEVHVVPESFESLAVRKGRALEWARRNLETDREFVLLLDEDTLVRNFEGVPDADVVQFSERPARTRSPVTYLTEIFRMGFQLEQRAFPRLAIPLYAWGGGLAVRTSVEQAVTWDRPSLVEDSLFVWRAMRGGDREFAFVDARFENQAPPTLRSMLTQRRRWMAGTLQDDEHLPLRYCALYAVRNLAWAATAIAPFLALAAFALDVTVPLAGTLRSLGLLSMLALYVWALLGWRYYRGSLPVGVALLALTPLLAVLHAAGALYGMVDRPSDFTVTEKAVPESSAERDTSKVTE